jgi:hypothetical protein
MERLGQPRHRRAGRRLSERELSESNLWLFALGKIQRCLHFGRHDKRPDERPQREHDDEYDVPNRVIPSTVEESLLVISGRR